MLDRIIARTREDLAERKRRVPLTRLLAGLGPSRRDFVAALRAPRTGFVLECKRASPSEGLIREPFDPAAIAADYAPFADAISVLTDRPFFQGSLDDLQLVSGVVDVPVLRKDFVVDPYQVVESRAYGADAVLLMLSVLDEASWRDCAAAAAETGIATLTEVHTPDELELALRLGAPVIGINNRDLTTLRVDLEVTRRLAPRVPADRVVICESGIRSHAEVRRLAPLVDGFLVGTSLMRAPILPEAVRALVFGMTKVCGLTRPEDAHSAFAAGATHGGLIFAPASPRRVTADQAAVVRQAAPLRWVGVFVNERADVVADHVRRLGLAAVQLHGEESRDDIAALRLALPEGCEVWKAVPVIDRIPVISETGADRVVLDSASPTQRGGTGERWDWSLLSAHPELDRLVLAGGLNPELARAAEATGVGGLDVNSGVEERPGIKSAVRLADFFRARRGLGRKRSAP